MVVDGFCVPLLFPHAWPGPPTPEHLCWWRSTCPPPPSCIHLCIPVFVMTKLWWKPWRPALWALLWSSAQVCLLPFPALQLLHSRPQLAPFLTLSPPRSRWTCLRVHCDVLDRHKRCSAQRTTRNEEIRWGHVSSSSWDLSGVSLESLQIDFSFVNVLWFVYRAIV